MTIFIGSNIPISRYKAKSGELSAVHDAAAIGKLYVIFTANIQKARSHRHQSSLLLLTISTAIVDTTTLSTIS